MTETLIAAAEPDRFTSESPIRAFTEFRVAGTWAIGKGFRPSLAHLHTYLDAMQNKEGWHLIQIIDGGTLDPTLIFQRDRTMAFTVPKKDPLTIETMDAWFRDQGFVLISTPEGNLRYEPERKIDTLHPIRRRVKRGSDEDKTPEWMKRGSDVEIPHEHREACAKMVIERVLNAANSGHAIERTLKEFKKRFLNPKGTPLPPHDALASQLIFLLPKANPVRVKQMIDDFREHHRLGFREPYKDFASSRVFVDDVDPASREPAVLHRPVLNVGDDPINPKHYSGRACADIGERLSANGYQILKYCWRLGKKDDPCQELGKALWYAESEARLMRTLGCDTHNPDLFIKPNRQGISRGGPFERVIEEQTRFLESRLIGQEPFTQNIATALWIGYGKRELRTIIERLRQHKTALENGRGLEP